MATAICYPSTGFLRLNQIIGDKKCKPPVPGIFPISRSSWWDGIRKGRYPKPIKLGPHTTAWKIEDIRALVERTGAREGAQ